MTAQCGVARGGRTVFIHDLFHALRGARSYAASSAVFPATLLGSGSASSRSSASALGVSLGAALGFGADQISDCIVSTCAHISAPRLRRDLAETHRRDYT